MSTNSSESQKVLARTFTELLTDSDDLYNITILKGIYFETSSNPIPDVSVDFGFGFHPREIVTVVLNNRPQLAYKNNIRTFHFATTKKSTFFDFSALFALNSSTYSMNFKPSEMANCSLKLAKYNGKSATPTLSSQFKSSNAALDFVLNFRDMKTWYSANLMLSLFNRMCLQVVRLRDAPYQYSFLARHKFNKTNLTGSVVLSSNAKYFTIRSKTTVNENTRAGIKYEINQNLESLLTLGYKTLINHTLVHSVINSNFVVSSYINKKVSDTFSLIFTTSLDHPAKEYSFGIGLSWEPPGKD